jgi:hypothetical protein
MTSVAKPTLAPFYDLTNFQMVLSAVSDRYADMYSQSESEFILKFARLPTASAALLVRMIMRTHLFFGQGGSAIWGPLVGRYLVKQHIEPR